MSNVKCSKQADYFLHNWWILDEHALAGIYECEVIMFEMLHPPGK